LITGKLKCSTVNDYISILKEIIKYAGIMLKNSNGSIIPIALIFKA